MTEVRKHSVFFVGQPGPVEEAFSDVSLNPDIRMQTLHSNEDCFRSLSEEDCDLLVFDFNGDSARVLNLLTELEQSLPRTPKLALVDHGDIPTAVRATKAGAANCLEKPVETVRLKSEIEDLLGQSVRESANSTSVLTPMEKTVLRLILDGKTNYEAALALHRSPRTVEVHRKNIMGKLRVSNTVELVKTAMLSGFFDSMWSSSLPVRTDELPATTR